MNTSKQQLESVLSHINELIENNLIDEACSEYITFAQSIEDNSEDSIKAEFYASFACFLFEVSEYEESLNMFIMAQNYGYSKKEIRKLVWEAFVQPNLNEFKSIYEQNIEFLLSKRYIRSYVEFDELPFWLIPTMAENEYFIYDKNEEIISEKICIDSNCNKYYSLQISDEFSDFLILEEWNWSNIQPYVNFTRKNNKKSYIVVNNFSKFLSFFQGIVINDNFISNILIFDGFNSLKEYFKCNSEYLPRNMIDLVNEGEQAKKIIDQIHSYRISKQGRKGDNILLSICIPSYNRGKRAYDNIIYSLKSYYDEEIEIVLSNNGTKDESKQYYDKINEIQDSRLNYFEFEENQGFAINLCKVCELARGKFILLLSDEDLVNFNVLHKVMNIINNGKENLSIVRTMGNGQLTIVSEKLAKPGEDAIFTYMLTSNYVSGIIINRSLLKKYNGIEYIKENLDNSTCFYYPHMFWELLLCQYGSVQGTSIPLIYEGKPEKIEVPKKEVGLNTKCVIPYYATIEGRLYQHEGFLYIFKDLEICKKSFEIFREMYMKLCTKTIFLVNISISVFYKNTDINIIEILDKAYETCVKYLDEVYVSQENENKKCYSQDVEQIKYYCDYYKNQI